MTPRYASMTLTDVVLLLSRLWDESDHSVFFDSSEEGFNACSLTFFRGNNHSTIGIVYTPSGGGARVFNSNMETIAQTMGKFRIDDYRGIRNMMLKIQKALPLPEGINPIIKEIQ